MTIPILSQLIGLIEAVVKEHGKDVAQAAGQAAATAALGTAESDPKTQAITAASLTLLAAAQNLKETLGATEPPKS